VYALIISYSAYEQIDNINRTNKVVSSIENPSKTNGSLGNIPMNGSSIGVVALYSQTIILATGRTLISLRTNLRDKSVSMIINIE